MFQVIRRCLRHGNMTHPKESEGTSARREIYKMTENDMIQITEWMKRITKEVDKVKRVVTAIYEGTSFTEAFEEVEEVFLETKQDEKKGYAYLSRMIEHLLKIKYCSNDRNYDHWRGEINGFRVKAIDITGWKSKRNRDTNLVKYLTNNIDDIYEVAVAYYKDDARLYADLTQGLEYIPEECPWTLEELMDDTIDEILKKLPGMEEN